MITNTNTAIIREVYDNENSEDIFEQELERALEAGYEIIIIEPNRLAEETARWIKVGNCLHKCAVILGLSSICISITWNRNNYTILIPFTIASVFCAGLYMISWQFDPCCKYQVANNLEKLKSKQLCGGNAYEELFESVTTAISTSPVILIREDDSVRKILHTTVAFFAFTLAIVRFYK